MSDVAVPPQAAPASTAPWPFPRRLAAVFTAPRALFEHLADRPSWLLPFVLLLLAGTAFVVFTWNDAWVPEMTTKMEEQGAGGEAMEWMTTNGMVLYSFIIPIFAAIFTLAYGAAVMFTANFVLGGKMAFKQAMSVVSHAGLVGLVGLPIRILLANASSSPRVTLGPGALLPADQQEGFAMKFLANFLQAFDLFTLWQTVLVGIGVAVIARVAPRSAMIAMFALFVVFSLLGALVGAVSGG